MALLDVGDGNTIWWEADGTGPALVVVHGGPGSGSSPGPAITGYRTVRYDQRGCGRSTPWAGDPAVDLSTNTTAHLVADLERLREHLGVDRWVLFGGSWGSTLILAYAVAHPDRVAGVVIAGVTTGRHAEVDWLLRGVGRFFPEAWARFSAAAGDAADLPAAYARLVADADPAVREAATAAWIAWEDAVISQESGAGAYGARPSHRQRQLVRICTHYFAHGLFLDDGVLLRDAARLAGIPAVLLQGALDMAGPVENAWLLARAWPGAELEVVDGTGHMGGPAMTARIAAALDRVRARHEVEPDPAWDACAEVDGVLVVELSWAPDALAGRGSEIVASPALVAALAGMTGFRTAPARGVVADGDAPPLVRLVVGEDPRADLAVVDGFTLTASTRAVAVLRRHCARAVIGPVATG